ncbi:Precorrin-3B C(17)-methyltransferase [Chelatococcus asaccharovorans]|nr:Precorrin-3B C(17)-methyltransferase [Chelatococcus asaccharovorans]CAH1682807.1 Precorrin-3B C(17)-methyltransferase [Chelatococcus asaccharovorans]
MSEAMTGDMIAENAGWLVVVGLGPGPDRWITPAVSAVLDAATDIIGYGPYTARLPVQPGRTVHASDNRVEIERARHALELAGAGRRVAVVSGGDPGVFAMAAAVFEAIEHGPAAWRALDIRVEPGVTAMLAAAARVGAPLGHDFAAISLSDNLKPWDIILKRLRLAAEADLVIALYNPVSRARPDKLREAFAVLGAIRAGDTPVIMARAVGRPDERIALTTLGEAAEVEADMATVVIIGSSETRLIAREGVPFVYTPRSYGAGR